jgi:uncharacterized damage-inducible protein DinB
MLAYHRRLFTFDHWANRVSLDAVAPVADRVPRSVAWLNHIMGANRIWLARVTGTSAPSFGLYPTLTVADLSAEFQIAHDGWAQFLASQTDVDLARPIRYANLKGDPVALADILAHVPLHGQHHRGQVNADLRAAGFTPPRIDYVHAARSGVLDT